MSKPSPKSLPSVSLAYKDGGSDKVYHVQLVGKDNLYVVNFQYGRRNESLKSGTKTTNPVTYEQALKIFDKLVAEKASKGYSEGASGIPYIGSENAGKVSGFIPQLPNFVKDDNELQDLLESDLWMMQEKYDGVNYSLRKTKGVIEGINRKGLVVDVPETILGVANGIAGDFLICGERIGDVLYAFDCLQLGSLDLSKSSASDRWLMLTANFYRGADAPSPNIVIVKTYFTKHEKVKAFEAGKKNGVEGFVFKHVDSLFVPGRPASGGNHRKYKFYASGTFKVLGINDKRSVEVGVKVPDNGDEFDCSVGNVLIPVNHKMPKKGDLVEVEYLYAFPDGGSIFQSIYHGIRTDKDEPDTYGSLKFKAGTTDE